MDGWMDGFKKALVKTRTLSCTPRQRLFIAPWQHYFLIFQHLRVSNPRPSGPESTSLPSSTTRVGLPSAKRIPGSFGDLHKVFDAYVLLDRCKQQPFGSHINVRPPTRMDAQT